VKLAHFPLLTDENIDAEIVRFLRGSGFDVCDVCEKGLQGATDIDLISRAVSENRVIVTHDADFGTLAVHAGVSIVGIMFLRPGHIDPAFTIETIKAILDRDLDVTAPFVLVARRSGLNVTIRYRPLGSGGQRP
jgi:predicted nuclease of predicted toxin-antitoxin system